MRTEPPRRVDWRLVYTAAMTRSLQRIAEFWREAARDFHHVGAVLPSGRSLAHAITRQVSPGRMHPGDDTPIRVLEVGSGMGAFTRHILAKLRPVDELTLVERNQRFASSLRQQFVENCADRAQSPGILLLNIPVQELAPDVRYDRIISGLPLNNFTADEVARILNLFVKLLEPAGTLSFFQYIGIRRMRSALCSRQQRARLREVGIVIERFFQQHHVDSEAVLLNVPPAWVHHVRAKLLE